MWKFTFVKQEVNSEFICDESEAAGVPGGESFFSRPLEKNNRIRARENRRDGNGIHRPYSKKDIVENPLHHYI